MTRRRACFGSLNHRPSSVIVTAAARLEVEPVRPPRHNGCTRMAGSTVPPTRPERTSPARSVWVPGSAMEG